MRTLYESILDDDEQVGKNAENSIAQTCLDFLSHSNFWKFCTYTIKGSELYVLCKKDYRGFKKFDIVMIGDEAVFDKTPEEHATINTQLLDYTYFIGCDFAIDLMLGEVPGFLANCTNCTITLNNAGNEDLKEVAKLMRNTKHNNLIIHGEEKAVGKKINYSDYSNLKDIDFGKCEITLYDCAHLETLKGIKAEKLVLQTWNSYNGESANADRKVLKDEYLDSILKDNDIKCLGMIDPHVQYTDWIVRKGDTYEMRPIKTGAKIVPKVNG